METFKLRSVLLWAGVVHSSKSLLQSLQFPKESWHGGQTDLIKTVLYATLLFYGLERNRMLLIYIMCII